MDHALGAHASPLSGRAGLQRCSGCSSYRTPPSSRAGHAAQMVSLLHLADINEEGVTFQSPTDGKRMLLTPEHSIQVGPSVEMVEANAGQAGMRQG